MKTKLTLLMLCLAPLGAIADDHGPDAGRLPDQGIMTAGKGADGNLHFILTDNTGIVSTSATTSTGAAAGATLVNSAAYEASRVLKASAGTLISVAGYSSKASAQFIQLFNSATVPADTAVPVFTFTVPATSNFSFDVPITGMPFTTGIAVSNSSTGPTKTIGAADCYFTATVK